MNRKIKINLAALLMLVFSAGAFGQALSDFQRLSKAASHRLRPFSELEVTTTPLVDCSHIPAEHLEADTPLMGLSQWIYNASYAWNHISVNGGVCIFLKSPEKRGLTREEARMLLSASKLSWSREEQRTGLSEKLGYRVVFSDEMPNQTPIEEVNTNLMAPAGGPGSLPIVTLNPDGTFPTDEEAAKLKEQQPKCADPRNCRQSTSVELPNAVIDQRQILYRTGYPYNLLALVRRVTPGGYRDASAVQLSPYVFAGVAHTVYDLGQGRRFTGKLTLNPRYKIPNAGFSAAHHSNQELAAPVIGSAPTEHCHDRDHESTKRECGFGTKYRA